MVCVTRDKVCIRHGKTARQCVLCMHHYRQAAVCKVCAFIMQIKVIEGVHST